MTTAGAFKRFNQYLVKSFVNLTQTFSYCAKNEAQDHRSKKFSAIHRGADALSAKTA